MFTPQALRGTVHGGGVQRPHFPGGATAPDGAARALIEYQIAVFPRMGLEAGVKTLVHRHHPAQAHVGGQQAVAAQQPGIGRARGVAVEMDHLLQGMDARVGAPGGDDPHRLVGHRAQRGLDRALYRRPFGQALPAGIGAAQVLDTRRPALAHRGQFQTMSSISTSSSHSHTRGHGRCSTACVAVGGWCSMSPIHAAARSRPFRPCALSVR